MFKNRGWFYFLLLFPTGIFTSLVYDYIENQLFLTALNQASSFLVSMIFPNTSINLKPWWIYAFLCLIMLIATVLFLINRKKIPPELADYTEDQFKNWYWRWEWGWNDVLNQWEVIRLTPFCPDCDVQLLDKSSSIVSIAGCPQCHKNFDGQLGQYDDTKGIEYLIHKKIREKKN